MLLPYHWTTGSRGGPNALLVILIEQVKIINIKGGPEGGRKSNKRNAVCAINYFAKLEAASDALHHQ